MGASPQLENGFIRIAREIACALMRTNLTPNQSRVLWAIWHQTYGWNKKEDWLSNSQLVELTGIRKQHVTRTKKELLERQIVTQRGYKVGFQKDYTRWCELPMGYRANGKKKLPNGVTAAELPNGVTVVTQRGGNEPNGVTVVTQRGTHNRKDLNNRKKKKKKTCVLCVDEFVQMTDEELKKLVEQFGDEFTDRCLLKLNTYKGSTGKKYKSDYMTMFSWVVDSVKGKEPEEENAKRRFLERV